MQSKNPVTMLAVNIPLIDQLLCSLVWVLSLGLNFNRSWHVIMNINIWQPQEKRIEKQWVKLFWWMICGSLWIFAQSMNGRMRFLFKAAAFSISYLYSWGKILLDIWSGDIYFSPGLAQIWSGPSVMLPLGKTVYLSEIRMQFSSYVVSYLCSLSIFKNDLFIQLIVTKTHQLSNSVFSIKP